MGKGFIKGAVIGAAVGAGVAAVVMADPKKRKQIEAKALELKKKAAQLGGQARDMVDQGKQKADAVKLAAVTAVNEGKKAAVAEMKRARSEAARIAEEVKDDLK